MRREAGMGEDRAMNSSQGHTKLRIRSADNRIFGLGVAGLATLVAAWPLFDGLPYHRWPLWCAVLLAAIAVVRPGLLTPLTRLWIGVGGLLHRITNPVLLAVIFFGAVMPTGLIMRAFGKRPLRLGRDAGAETYWLERAPPGPAPESQKNQF